MTSHRTQILVVGNYCHDTIITRDDKTFQALGGSPAYISSVLSALQVPFDVIAKVGGDFRYSDQVLKKPLVDPNSKTTAFLDDLRGKERIATLEAKCSPILPKDIVGDARVSICCGVVDEIRPETLLHLRNHSEFTLCDIQGLIRHIDAAGKVQNTRLEDTPYAAILESIDFLKLSVEEARFVDLQALRLKTTAIVTDGPNGCTILTRDQQIHIPGIPVDEKDGTGAGDSFLAGFAYGVLNNFPLDKSGKLACFCGALAVTQVGVPKITPDHLAGFLNLGKGLDEGPGLGF